MWKYNANTLAFSLMTWMMGLSTTNPYYCISTMNGEKQISAKLVNMQEQFCLDFLACTTKTPAPTALITWMGFMTCEGTLLGMLMLCRTVSVDAVWGSLSFSMLLWPFLNSRRQKAEEGFHTEGARLWILEAHVGTVSAIIVFWLANLEILVDLYNAGDSHMYWLN